MDGSHQLSSPGSGTQGREQQLGQHGQQGSLVDRIALWWEGRKATNATAADEAAAAAGAGVTPRTTMPHSPRTPPHSIGSPQLSVRVCAAPAAVLLSCCYVTKACCCDALTAAGCAVLCVCVLRLQAGLQARRPPSSLSRPTPGVCPSTLYPCAWHPQGVNADELIEPSPESTAKMGCIHLFGASHSLAHKRFLRLSKPAAGSSFRVRFPWAGWADRRGEGLHVQRRGGSGSRGAACGWEAGAGSAQLRPPAP